MESQSKWVQEQSKETRRVASLPPRRGAIKAKIFGHLIKEVKIATSMKTVKSCSSCCQVCLKSDF